MTKTVLVQARTSSQRLPRKVLRTVGGKPMLQFLVERLQHCAQVDQIIVATSDDASDAPLADLCRHLDVTLERGPLDDVVERLLGVARRRRLDAFVRVSGDSPLLDSAVVDRGIALFEQSACDLATNVFPRSYPKGQSVEVISTQALARAADMSDDAQDREHVTRYFYRHPSAFRIANFAGERDLSAVQLSVDSPEDFAAFERIATAMTRPHWEYGLEDVLELKARSECARHG